MMTSASAAAATRPEAPAPMTATSSIVTLAPRASPLPYGPAVLALARLRYLSLDVDPLVIYLAWRLDSDDRPR